MRPPVKAVSFLQEPPVQASIAYLMPEDNHVISLQYLHLKNIYKKKTMTTSTLKKGLMFIPSIFSFN